MTPEQLERSLAPLALAESSLERPDLVLRELESRAEAHPADRQLAALIRELARMMSADRGLAPVLAGVRRERLVRWDADSTTWVGVDIETGRRALVRALRPELDEPVLRRALARDARALSPVLEHLRLEGPVLVSAAPGVPLDEAIAPEDALRLWGTILAPLSQWERAAIGLPVLSADEIRHDGRRAWIVCLTPVHAPDQGPLLARLAARFQPPEDTPAARLLAGVRELPPRDATEAVELWTTTLADELTRRRVELARRWRRTHRAFRVESLRSMLSRLDAAVPPPRGRGAVGVDLEGRITIVDSDGHTVRWGPVDDPTPIWAPGLGLDAVGARRMLRARASAPPNPRLDAAVGGDPAATEALGRWTAAALRLRTLRLLLDPPT